jgi:hypothetical protein
MRHRDTFIVIKSYLFCCSSFCFLAFRRNALAFSRISAASFSSFYFADALLQDIEA